MDLMSYQLGGFAIKGVLNKTGIEAEARSPYVSTGGEFCRNSIKEKSGVPD